MGMIAEITKQPVEAEPDTTLGNYIESKLGKLTHSGGTVRSGSLKFIILQIRRRKAHMILVEATPLSDSGSVSTG